MTLDWFRPRGYRHFDAAVGHTFAQRICKPSVVEQHSWLPLIHYVKRIKRYKISEKKTVYKDRDIMFASHRDACILSKYANDITRRLALQLPFCFEVRALSDCLVSSAPE